MQLSGRAFMPGKREALGSIPNIGGCQRLHPFWSLRDTIPCGQMWGEAVEVAGAEGAPGHLWGGGSGHSPRASAA